MENSVFVYLIELNFDPGLLGVLKWQTHHMTKCYPSKTGKSVCFSRQLMSTDKYPNIFPHQMEAIVYLVYTVRVDSIEGTLWLASQIPNILCYLPPSYSGKNGVLVCTRDKRRNNPN